VNGGGGRWPYLAARHDIVVWADRVDAPPILPRLVRRLIDQTNDQVVELQMRADEGTRLGGYDGFSRALRGTPFVPEGAAVWEMSTEDPPGGKANEDYEKRTKEPRGIKPDETTFVFVTPRQWSGKNDWANRKRAERVWANVVAYDVDDIDQAFERAPAAHMWFSEVVGLPAQGAQSLTQWWDRFSQLSSPPLTPELVLAGRTDAAADLLRILEGPAQVTTVSAHNEEELLVFVAAVVLSVPEDERVRALDARSIIVKDGYTLQRLEHSPDSLVLVPFHDELRREARLVQSHHVVIRADDGAPTTIPLPEIDIQAFQTVLVADGVPEERAFELARLARRSIYAFQRATPVASLAGPEWASQLDSAVVRRAWLVGRWDERRSGDIDALSDLFGMPYAEAREEVVRLSRGADPLFVRVGDTWTVTSLDDAWTFGHAYLEPPDLTSFEVLIQSVLGAVDPRLEMPVADRWMAAVYGKTPVHSGDLRQGVAEVLALMGAKGQDVSIGSGPVQSWLHSVLHRLFDRLNEDLTGQLWASLTDVLPLLAEAAPDAFLQGLETGLQGEQPLVQMMFADNEESGSLSISSPHTGLLWALEGLAWSSEHFGQVVEQLARLAEVDPGGRLSNRPAGSLASIFRPWLPQTSVDAGRRIAALDVMRERHSSVAWKLLLSMLPEHHAVGFYSHKPRYRDWPTERQPVTRGQLGELYVAAAERAIEHAGIDAERWVELIERFDDLPAAVFPHAVEALRAVTSDEGSPGLREQTWEALRDQVMRHRRYASADWALDSDRLDQLDELQQSLAPSDPVELVRWLFDEDVPDVAEEDAAHFEAGRFLEALAQKRAEAIHRVHDAAGSAGVLRLAAAAKLPWFVGDAVGRANLIDAGTQLFEHIDAEDELTAAARAWTGQRARTLGWAWVEAQVTALSGRPLAQARVLLESSELERAWSRAREESDVDEAYWAEFMPYGRGRAFELAERAARELLAHDRPRAALVLMNLYAGEVGIDRSIVMDALERVATMPLDHPDQFRVDSYEIERLLEYVRSGDVDEDRLVMLEWRLRPALRFDANSPLLERRLARDPAFFVEVLSLCFKPQHGEPDADIPMHVARNAYQLLQDWNVVPGSDGPGESVDEERLNHWVNEALVLLQEADREMIGLEVIGHVLAKTVGDTDETWPTRPVRQLIERLQRTELDNGFEVEVFNSRGTTSRGLTDGGEQERVLLATYQGLAQEIADEWPRTAAILRSIAEGYQEQARRHDEEARRFLEGLEG
jgi:hypothetical protein